jgi:hypothetical protein
MADRINEIIGQLDNICMSFETRRGVIAIISLLETHPEALDEATTVIEELQDFWGTKKAEKARKTDSQLQMPGL